MSALDNHLDRFVERLRARISASEQGPPTRSDPARTARNNEPPTPPQHSPNTEPMMNQSSARQRLVLWHILNRDHSARMVEACEADLDAPACPDRQAASCLWDWWTGSLHESTDAFRLLAGTSDPALAAGRLHDECEAWHAQATNPIDARAAAWGARRFAAERSLELGKLTYAEVRETFDPSEDNEPQRDDVAWALAGRRSFDTERLAAELIEAAKSARSLLRIAERELAGFGLPKRRVEWALDHLALRTVVNQTPALDELLNMLITYSTRALHSDYYERVVSALPRQHRRRIHLHLAKFADVAFGECPESFASASVPT